MKILFVQIAVYLITLFLLIGCVTTANESDEDKTFARFVEKSHKPIKLSPNVISSLQNECDDGNYLKCHLLGVYYAQETDWNASLTVANFFKACEAGFNRACDSLGGLYLGVRDLERDVTKAIKFIQTACDAGYSKACTHLAVLYREGDGVWADLERAGKLFEKACRFGYEKDDGRACFYTGKFYLEDGSSLDGAVHANVFFKQSCDRGFRPGCDVYQRMSRDGKVTGSLVSPFLRFELLSDAVVLYQDLCNSGDPNACNGLGEMYKWSGKENRNKAIESYQLSCDAGIIVGCFNLGLKKFMSSWKNAYQKELGKMLTVGFTPEVVELFNLSCEKGFAKGCEYLAPAYYVGEGGVTRDLNKYKELRRKACRLDESICTSSSLD